MKLPAFLTTAPSIGDFICSTPTIRKIAKTYGTKVLVISPNPNLLKNNPYVSESLDINSVDVSLLEQTYDIHRSGLFKTCSSISKEWIQKIHS